MTDHTPISKVSRLEVVSTGARRRWTLEEKQLSGDAVPALVPFEITSTLASASTCAPQPPSPPAQHTKAGIIEIELAGCRVRVDRDVDAGALQCVLELLRRR
jgi:transposase